MSPTVLLRRRCLLVVLALAASLRAAPVKVACVGDSITAGVGASAGNSYPAVLGRLLGEGYEVRNFGVSARTLLSAGDYPWIREQACADAMAYLPNAVVIMLGTNDSKPPNWAHRADFRGDYAALIDRFAGLDSKPTVYACLPVPAFPGNWGINDPVILDEICPIIREVVKEKGARLIDLHTPLVGLGEFFPDKVHPNDSGAFGMAMVVNSVISAPENAANTALTPVPKLENDSYDWYARHEAVLKLVPTANPDVVMVGDSITHFWGGEPRVGHARAQRVWDDLYGTRRVLNLGFGWDRTQNVLWRIDHGEFDGLRPKLLVLHIGTNNLTGTGNARENTPAEIAEGITAIIDRVRARSPYTKILLMGVMPRGGSPTDGFRPKIAAINKLLAPLGKQTGIVYVDLADKLLEADGTLPKTVMDDGTHPTPEGYRRWAEVIRAQL